MTVTIDNFLARYPVFEGISEDIIAEEIAVAQASLQQWQQPQQDKGVMLLVAHILRLEHGDLIKLGSGLRSLEEGSEIKNDLVDLSLPYYQQTIYGQQFLNLRNTISGISMFVI